MPFALRHIFPQNEKQPALPLKTKFVFRPSSTYVAPASLHVETAETVQSLPVLKQQFADPVDGAEPELSICVLDHCFVLPGGAVITEDGSLIAESMAPFIEPALPETFKDSLMGENGSYSVRLENYSVAREPLFNLRERGEAGYFHWMHSILPKLGLMNGFSKGYQLKILCRLVAPFQVQSLDMLGLQGAKLQQMSTHQAVFCPTLYFTTPMVSSGDFWKRSRFVSDYLRRLALTLEKSDHEAPYIYINRKDTTVRKISNEDELIAALEKRGFISVELGGMLLADQIKLIRGAKTVVSAHGAGLANISFADKDCRVLEIISPSRLWPTYRAIAARNQQTYGFVLAEVAGADGHFHVDVNKVMQTLDMLG